MVHAGIKVAFSNKEKGRGPPLKCLMSFNKREFIHKMVVSYGEESLEMCFNESCFPIHTFLSLIEEVEQWRKCYQYWRQQAVMENTFDMTHFRKQNEIVAFSVYGLLFLNVSPTPIDRSKFGYSNHMYISSTRFRTLCLQRFLAATLHYRPFQLQFHAEKLWENQGFWMALILFEHLPWTIFSAGIWTFSIHAFSSAEQ